LDVSLPPSMFDDEHLSERQATTIPGRSTTHRRQTSVNKGKSRMSDSLKEKIEGAVDNAAGAGTSDKIEGKVTEVVGQAQEKLGEVTGDKETEARGVVNQADGQAQEKVGDVKEHAENLIETVKEKAHDAAEKAHDVAEDAVDAVKDAAHNIGEKLKKIF
jgi:uncharacterized protein YjbJ (UPF0337 family)